MASWHLVEPGTGVHSGGAAVAPLLRMLPGGRPPAAIVSRVPRTAERAYGWVARHRGRLGDLLGRGSLARADRVIATRRKVSA
jgi:hypothetical protein